VLWSERYEGELSDIFKFQDAIARQIAGKLAANVTQIEGRLARTRPIPKLDAYDLVLRARSVGFTSTRAANRNFRTLTTKAIKLDPNYALAHALLAEAIIAQAILGWTEFRDQALARAETLTRRAIALAPGEPDGHRVLGRLLVVRAEYDQAQAELRRAIEINPSDSNALAVWGNVQLFVGDTAGAIEALERALKYDPALEALHVFDLSVAYYLAHRHQAALRTAERGLTQFPDFAMLNVIAAAASAQLGRKKDAARFVREVRRQLPLLNVDELGSRFRNPSQAVYLREGLKRAGL
jgi:adenylate cyclase